MTTAKLRSRIVTTGGNTNDDWVCKHSIRLQPVTIQPKEMTWTCHAVMTLIQKPTN